MADMPDPAMEDAGAPSADDAAPDMSGGYCIELRVSADGKISVGVEPLAAEEGEEGGGASEEDYQQVPTIGDAVRLVREIYNHAGSLQSDAAGEDQMAAGYR